MVYKKPGLGHKPTFYIPADLNRTRAENDIKSIKRCKFSSGPGKGVCEYCMHSHDCSVKIL